MKYLALLLFLLNQGINICAQKNIIFEIDNIVFEIDEIRHAKETNFFGSFLSEDKVKSYINYYSEKFFELLHSIEDYDHLGQENLVFKQKQIPSIMCAYLLDEINSQNAFKVIEDKIKSIYSHFAIVERNILLHAAKMGFLPENIVSCIYPIEQGIDIVLRCLANKKNRIFLLTNDNSESMDALQKKFKGFFDNFHKDQIVFSGKLKKLKPHIDSYVNFLQQYQLNPEECYFIESEKSCIDSIKQIPGTKVVLCNNKKFEELHAQFLSHGLY